MYIEIIIPEKYDTEIMNIFDFVGNRVGLLIFIHKALYGTTLCFVNSKLVAPLNIHKRNFCTCTTNE